MLLLCARTSVNESRSTRTALLHAILPDLLEKPPKARSVTVHSFAGRRSETMLNASRNILESVIKASRGFRSDLTAKGAGFNSWRGENWAQEKAINYDYLKSSSGSFSRFSGKRSQGQCRRALSEWRMQQHWVQLDWIMGLLDWLKDNHRAKVAAVL